MNEISKNVEHWNEDHVARFNDFKQRVVIFNENRAEGSPETEERLHFFLGTINQITMHLVYLEKIKICELGCDNKAAYPSDHSNLDDMVLLDKTDLQP